MPNDEIRQQIEYFALPWEDVARMSGYNWNRFHFYMTRREMPPAMRKRVKTAISRLAYNANNKDCGGMFKPWEMLKRRNRIG